MLWFVQVFTKVSIESYVPTHDDYDDYNDDEQNQSSADANNYSNNHS